MERCEECGLEFKAITTPHLKKHNLTFEEYYKKHPKQIMLKREKVSATQLAWLGLIIGIISLFVTIAAWWLAIDSVHDLQAITKNTGNSLVAINETIQRLSPINLTIWHQVDEEKESIYIYGRNNDKYRSTGPIYLYRLEVNPNRPFMQKTRPEDFLNPNETQLLFNLSINIKWINVTPPQSMYDQLTIPYVDTYFCEECYISYKIMCNECAAQGIVRKTMVSSNKTEGDADFQYRIHLSPNNTYVQFPIHTWVVTTLKDVEVK